MSEAALSREAALPAGLVRSARLLRALGPRAAEVWAELPSGDAARLSAAMDRIEEDDRLDEDAASAFLSNPARDEAGGIWDRLSALRADELATLLTPEHPQVIALCLSRIGPASAARAVRHMPSLLAVNVLKRMMQADPPQRAALQAIEQSLAARLQVRGACTGGEQRLARIFDELDTDASRTLLSALETAEPVAGRRIRELMFTFEDLAALSPAAIQTLLSRAGRATLTMALKGSAGPVRDTLFANMTARARDVLADEMAGTGPMPRARVEAARAELVRLARDLIASGDILTGARPDEDLVE